MELIHFSTEVRKKEKKRGRKKKTLESCQVYAATQNSVWQTNNVQTWHVLIRIFTIFHLGFNKNKQKKPTLIKWCKRMNTMGQRRHVWYVCHCCQGFSSSDAKKRQTMNLCPALKAALRLNDRWPADSLADEASGWKKNERAVRERAEMPWSIAYNEQSVSVHVTQAEFCTSSVESCWTLRRQRGSQKH